MSGTVLRPHTTTTSNSPHCYHYKGRRRCQPWMDNPSPQAFPVGMVWRCDCGSVWVCRDGYLWPWRRVRRARKLRELVGG